MYCTLNRLDIDHDKSYDAVVPTPTATRKAVQREAAERESRGLPQIPTPDLQDVVRQKKKQTELELALARASEQKEMKKREEGKKRARECRRTSQESRPRPKRLTISAARDGLRDAVSGYRGTTAAPPQNFMDLNPHHQAYVTRAAFDFFVPDNNFSFIKQMISLLPASYREQCLKEVSDCYSMLL